MTGEKVAAADTIKMTKSAEILASRPPSSSFPDTLIADDLSRISVSRSTLLELNEGLDMFVVGV